MNVLVGEICTLSRIFEIIFGIQISNSYHFIEKRIRFIVNCELLVTECFLRRLIRSLPRVFSTKQNFASKITKFFDYLKESTRLQAQQLTRTIPKFQCRVATFAHTFLSWRTEGRPFSGIQLFRNSYLFFM